MSRLRLLQRDELLRDAERVRSRQGGLWRWRRASARYWAWQAAVAEHPRFESLRARAVRRLLVVVFALTAAFSLVVFWTQGLWTGWLHYVTTLLVVAVDVLIIIAVRGVTALPEHQLDELQLRTHRRLVTRAFWAVMIVVFAIAMVLPRLIEDRVIPPLDGGQVFALLWGLALLGGMTGICMDAWREPARRPE